MTISGTYKTKLVTLCLIILACAITSTPATADTEAPTVPQNLSAVAVRTTQVSLSWDASTDLGGGVVAGYDVWRDGKKVWGGVGLTGTSFIDTRAEPGTSYSYRVDAFDDASPRNKSAKSNLASVTTPASEPTADTEAPTVPQNLTANTTSPTQVNLVWDASTDSGGGVVAGYDVWRDGKKVWGGVGLTGTSFIDTRAEPGTSYSYRVDAFDDASPRNKSTKSNVASVTTPASEPTADTEAPTVPQNLTANTTSPTQVNLVWDASTDSGGGVVAGYDVWRDGKKVWGGVGLTGTSFIDTRAEPGTSYSYRVDAFDAASPRNKSTKSNVASVTTPATEPAADTEAPTVPQNLTASATSPTQVNLAWDASTDSGGGVVAGYDVWRDGKKVWGGVGLTGTSFIDTRAEPGTSYSYRVDAFDDASPRNKSTKSNVASVTTPSSSEVCNGVDIFPSYDAAALVSANPEGTTFCFKAGTHFLSAPIQTHSNDKYIGESGAILDGHDTITHAFFGRGDDQRNVTIRALVIQNFHNGYEDFNTSKTVRAGYNWTVENNEIRYNYETGIQVNRGMILRNNNIHHNGRYGITGGPGIAQNILIDGNEIAYNNSRDLPWATAGTAKVIGSQTGATGLTWINNWIHHNNGHGLHHDYNSGPDIEIAFNRIEDNRGNGIQHEASWGADIHDNVMINNFKHFIGKSCGMGGQILIRISSDVNIYNNHVESTEGGNGICLSDVSYPNHNPPGSLTINNVSVIGNTIKLIGSAQTGVTGPDAMPGNLDKNFFDLNTYYVPDPASGTYWAINITRAEWQAKGQDLGSVFLEW